MYGPEMCILNTLCVLGGWVLKHPKFMNLCSQGENNGERIPPRNDSSLKLILAFSRGPG